jgi:prepilin-type N-terminal cleavage/methylation domain-containing protein/prepilin-type processing-associated H-X9-DG protein
MFPTSSSARSSRRGFTLIELLVVIAIIAILAAILFPVFAQARAKARGMACLSNVKQVGTAFHMYLQDYDETTPSIWSSSGTCQPDGTNCRREWWNGLVPYIKSVGLLYCPERNEGGPGNYNVWEQSMGINKYVGYGYNWGPIHWRGGGLVGQQVRSGLGTQTFLSGKSLAQIEFPAQMFSFGDTYDTPRMTIGIGFAGDTWRGTSNGALRHTSGVFNFAYVDGHAKAIKVAGGWMNGAFSNRLVIPRDTTAASLGFCASPTEIIINGGASPDGTPVPSGLQCGQIGPWVLGNFRPCGATGTTNCIYND